MAGSTSKGASTAGRKVSKRGQGTRLRALGVGAGWGHVAHSARFRNWALLTRAEGSCPRSPEPDEIVPRIN